MSLRSRAGDSTGHVVAFTTSPAEKKAGSSSSSSYLMRADGASSDRQESAAAAAAFTRSVANVGRSDSEAPMGGTASGVASLASTLNGTSGEQVEYKGVTLLSGIEKIHFGDSYYLGTVDTDGHMAGYGKATWASGDEYEGEWLDDCMHGEGVYRWEDGDCYKGEYRNGYMNGFGEMRDATGVYVGDWVDDMRQGHGHMEYAGGNVYEGEWLGGMRHGHGKLIEVNGTVYEGEFVRNEKEGKGMQTNPDGDVYDGDFANGKPNGRGTYVWHDGAKYVGYFLDGLRHGEGCEWLPDGDWIAGNFVHGEHDEGQVVRHKAVASDFQEPELSDQMVTVLEPLDPEQLTKLSHAAQAAERRVGRGNSLINGTATFNHSNSGGAGAGTAAAASLRRGSGQRHQDPGITNGAGAAAGESTGAEGGEAHDGANGHNATGSTTHLQHSGTIGDGSSGSPSSPFAVALRPTQLSDGDLENWTQLRIIGKGSFGAVYEALLTTGRTVCCKVIELGNVADCEELDKLKNEIALMKRMHHPNIVQYYGSIEDKEKNTINIFMELVSGGSLNSFVKKFKTIPTLTMRQWTYQMVCGVKYLHDCGIVHRDIKGDNVLVSLDGIVKLADFGCSKSIDDACGATHGCATMVGTPYWMAPEVIKCEAGGYGAKSDIWSIGCTIVEMITGKPPWPECNSMWAAVYKIANSAGLPTEIPADLDPQLMNLLERCFERDPRKRASAAELLEHPFLVSVGNPSAAA